MIQLDFGTGSVPKVQMLTLSFKDCLQSPPQSELNCDVCEVLLVPGKLGIKTPRYF